MSEIFISYASADRDRARVLAEALTKRGYSVWWDRTIPPGRVFDEVIQEAIQGARCMIVLWSADSVRSNWVKTEAAEGVTRGILVPALIGDAAPPIEFKRIQSANLSQWEGDDTDGEYRNLLDSVEGLMKKEPGSGSAASTVKSYRPMANTAASYWGTIKTFGMGAIAALAVVVAVWLYGPFGKQRDTVPPVAGTAEPAKANTKSAPATVATAQTNPPAAVTAAKTSSPVRGRVNLLSEEHGGQLLVASSDKWKMLVDGKEDTYVWVDNGFGVFGFRDGKPALVDTFTVLVPNQNGGNLKEFELFTGNASPTGPFESIGRFSTQNMRIMQNPYQEFRFPPVKAKYFKVQSLRSHDDSSGAVSAYEIQLFGELQ
jgi:TIR domain